MTDHDMISYCQDLVSRSQKAARSLAQISTSSKNAWLLQSAEEIVSQTDLILHENKKDCASADIFGLTTAELDRLRLDPKRIASMAQGLRQISSLPDPIGEVREGHRRPNGLEVLKIGVPLGVIFFLYESRPNVTVDAAALCVKSGNAVILRGGKEALYSNRCLEGILKSQLSECDLPDDAVQLITTTDRDAVGLLLKRNDAIDLVIPRGGESLIRRVEAEATMPVLKHFQGNCHIYVDASADLTMATAIIVNAKCQRPGVCNATESLLLHSDIANHYLPILGERLRHAGVEIRGCEQTCQLLSWAKPATEQDFATEFLDLILSVKVVVSIDDAIEHIRMYGSAHTDAIIAQDIAAIRQFTTQVDSSAVVVNASTRFNDGYEIGLGGEIGISTDKFHARGPCGLRELTSYKYIITGNGQIRQ